MPTDKADSTMDTASDIEMQQPRHQVRFSRNKFIAVLISHQAAKANTKTKRKPSATTKAALKKCDRPALVPPALVSKKVRALVDTSMYS